MNDSKLGPRIRAQYAYGHSVSTAAVETERGPHIELRIATAFNGEQRATCDVLTMRRFAFKLLQFCDELDPGAKAMMLDMLKKEGA